MDYLSLIIGALVTDMFVMILFLQGIFKSKYFVEWYRKFGLGAVLADVTIIMLVIIVTYFIYSFLFTKFYLLPFVLLAVFIQIIHDLLFGYFISYSDSKSPILTIFKLYAKEHEFAIIFADSLMIISTILIMFLMKNLLTNLKLFILTLALYILTFLLYSF
jgi:hypothetical protein